GLRKLLAAGRAGEAHGGRRVRRRRRRAAVAGGAVQRERGGIVVGAAERAVEADGEARATADAAVPVGIAGDRYLRAAGGLAERYRPAVLQALAIGEAEEQRPAIGDGRAVVGDDDVGTEAVTAHPALGVGDLAGRCLGRRGRRVEGRTERQQQGCRRRPCETLSQKSHDCLLVSWDGATPLRMAPPVYSPAKS